MAITNQESFETVKQTSQDIANSKEEINETHDNSPKRSNTNLDERTKNPVWSKSEVRVESVKNPRVDFKLHNTRSSNTFERERSQTPSPSERFRRSARNHKRHRSPSHSPSVEVKRRQSSRGREKDSLHPHRKTRLSSSSPKQDKDALPKRRSSTYEDDFREYASRNEKRDYRDRERSPLPSQDKCFHNRRRPNDVRERANNKRGPIFHEDKKNRARQFSKRS